MIFLVGQQKSGASMLSLQRILEIQTYKAVWVMGHKIRKAMAQRDASCQLAGLIELDDTYVGSPQPGKRGRGAAVNTKSWWRWKTQEINHGLPPCARYPG